MAARSQPAGDTDYEQSGVGYETVRRADSRIAAQIHAALGDARSVLNVGAGGGSYEPTDRYVLAVEPSAAMRARRHAAGAVPAIDARAEDLPLDDNSVDAAMAVLTLHQWSDPDRGLAELRRVSRGPVVILTLDGTRLPDFWLGEYLPDRMTVEANRFPSVERIRAALGGTIEVGDVPIPLDCTDGFVEAFYGRPEALLDQAVRSGQSAWQFVDPAATAAGLDRLAEDLRSGAWDRRHGALRTAPTYRGPLVLIVAPGR